jgi:hypothetical protein
MLVVCCEATFARWQLAHSDAPTKSSRAGFGDVGHQRDCCNRSAVAICE